LSCICCPEECESTPPPISAPFYLTRNLSLLVVSGICYVLCVLLFAIIPENPNYWAYVFPSMLCATLGVDVTYNVTNIFITTSMPKARQGLAGALINSLLFLGISFFLGKYTHAYTGGLKLTRPNRLRRSRGNANCTSGTQSQLQGRLLVRNSMRSRGCHCHDLGSKGWKSS
jgi:hypothetical protein